MQSSNAIKRKENYYQVEEILKKKTFRENDVISSFHFFLFDSFTDFVISWLFRSLTIWLSGLATKNRLGNPKEI